MATDKVQGVYFDDTEVRHMSTTTGYVVDLICESEISGLVYEDYKDNGSNVAGTIGYTAGLTTKSFATDPDVGQLSSIYWNKTPVYDKDSNKFNYNNVDLITDQQTISQDGLNSRRLVQINEKLRGLERKTGDTIEFVKYYRYYTIRNKYCNKAIVNLRVNSLGEIDRNAGTASQPNEKYGELLDAEVTVVIEYRAKYALGAELFYSTPTPSRTEIKGALSSPYAKSVEIELPIDQAKLSDTRGDFIGWELRIHKRTEEPTTPDVRNEVFVDNIVEETQDKFIYPKSYVVKNTFDAENFSQIPERAYDMRLTEVKIPSNYDPITRTYYQDWDGTFSTEKSATYGASAQTSRPLGRYWTDNPAWCFYDLITNKRYGLGKYVDTSTLDKWTLYEIGRYCDELVEDYDNGLEPRFSCNIIIQSRADAYQVLNDMASVFRGIVYYNGGNLFAVQDSLKDPIFQFNNTSIENGEFKYSSTSAKVRHTVAIVRYNDKNNKFEPAVEYVEDVDAIRKYGIKEKEISAFGCTSKSQAKRLGRWILATESNETETVSFTCGHEGAILRPGDVFEVSDSNRSMTRRGGRIQALERTSDSTFKIALDSQLKGGKSWDGNNFITNDNLDSKREYKLTLSTPTYYYDTSQVNLTQSDQTNVIRNKQIQTFDISPNTISYDSNSGVSVLTVTGNLDQTDYTTSGFSGEALWSIATSGVGEADTFFEALPQEQQYRVINISERDKGKYEIAAAEYARVKYGDIDATSKPTNTVAFDVPSSPTSLALAVGGLDGAPNTKKIDITVGHSLDHDKSVAFYQVYIKKGSYPTETDSDSNIRISKAATATATFIPASDGVYYVRAYAYNGIAESNGSHGSAQANKEVVGINPIKDVQITHLSLLDDTTGGAKPNESDPTTAGDIDEFDDSTAQFKWQTSLPQFQGDNIALDFQYKLEVYHDHGPGTVKRTENNYKPDNSQAIRTTYDYTLANNYADSNNDYASISRDIFLRVFASTAAGETSIGYDDLKIRNSAPEKPTDLDGFIDLNNQIKIISLNRSTQVKEVIVFSSPTDFTYDEYKGGSRVDVEATRIAADVNVVEIRPNWLAQQQGGEDVGAYVRVAFVDQFDLDIEALAASNSDTFDLTKNLNNSRVSDAKELEKTTSESIELMGEGFQSWIQIDVDGKWYGRGIKCVEDVTDEYSDYAGYIPYYCSRMAPLIGFHPSFGAVSSPPKVNVGNFMLGFQTTGPMSSQIFSSSCGYYWPPEEDNPLNAVTPYPDGLSTQDISPIGGHDDESVEFTTTNEQDSVGDRTISATKGFKRYRVYFETQKTNPYWVLGQNVNNEPYYSDSFLESINAFFSPETAVMANYGKEYKAGAKKALDKATSAGGDFENKQLQIGSSDAYFNFHPAGFVQGFGGLPKKTTYFDVHMGHLADKSYLSRAMFLVVSTTEQTNQQKTVGDPQCSVN